MAGRIRASIALVVALVLVGALRTSGFGGAGLVPIRVSAGAVSVVEGDAGTRVVRIPVALSAPSPRPLRVHYAIGPYQPLGGAAADSTDMDAVSGTLRFDVRSDTGLTPDEATVSLRVHSDTAPEPAESYAVTLSELVTDGPAGSAVIGTPVAVGTIFDDDEHGASHLDVGSVTMPEGGPTTVHTAIVPVTLSRPVPTTVTVQYLVKGLTAHPGVDYGGPASGVLRFAPGELERTIAVPVLGDGEAESDEAVAVGLVTPLGAELGNSLGVVLIRDPTYFGATTGPRVGITGDSITDLAEPALRRELTARYSTSILAVPGATMAAMTPYLRDQVAFSSEATVVNLGTNDVLRDNRQWARDLAVIRATVARVPCVELVTINDTGADRLASLFAGRRVTVGAQLNRALRAFASSHPNVHLVDWKAAVDADLAPGGPDALLSDGIHPTALGQAWLARHIGDALARDCGASAR